MQEDIELYKDILSDLASKVNNDSKLLDRKNEVSLIAMIAYTCERDIKIDGWIVDYFDRNDSYIDNQVENFQYMKCDIEDFMKLSEVA